MTMATHTPDTTHTKKPDMKKPTAPAPTDLAAAARAAVTACEQRLVLANEAHDAALVEVENAEAAAELAPLDTPPDAPVRVALAKAMEVERFTGVQIRGATKKLETARAEAEAYRVADVHAEVCVLATKLVRDWSQSPAVLAFRAARKHAALVLIPAIEREVSEDANARRAIHDLCVRERVNIPGDVRLGPPVALGDVRALAQGLNAEDRPPARATQQSEVGTWFLDVSAVFAHH
jgi:hypothetical protein